MSTTREALVALVAVIDAAGLHNLTSGVQLGPAVWYVKAGDAMEAARSALSEAPAPEPQRDTRKELANWLICQADSLESYQAGGLADDLNSGPFAEHAKKLREWAAAVAPAPYQESVAPLCSVCNTRHHDKCPPEALAAARECALRWLAADPLVLGIEAQPGALASAMDALFVVEEFSPDGSSTGRYMLDQGALTTTHDVSAARKLHWRRTAEFRASVVQALRQCLVAMDAARDAIQPITQAQMKLHRLNPATDKLLDDAAEAAMAALAAPAPANHPAIPDSSAAPAGVEIERRIKRLMALVYEYASAHHHATTACTADAQQQAAKYRGDARAELERSLRLWLAAPLPTQPAAEPARIDMVLHCPACGLQHIDAPDFEDDPHLISQGVVYKVYDGWTNPPHRSHLCHGCGHIWRPADVPTNGVAAIKTRGKADYSAQPAAEQAAAKGDGA